MSLINSSIKIHWMSILMDMSFGKKFVIQPNTSFNGYMGIKPDEHCVDGEYPRLKYFGIGVGGEPMIDDSSYSYSATGAEACKLLNQIPFALKKPEEDLSPEEQAKYRFRTNLVIDDEVYIAYYLKDIGDYDSRDYYVQLDTEDGKTVPSKYNTNTDKIFNPVPINKNARISNIDNSKYITKFVKVFFELDIVEQSNLFEVFKLLKLNATHITEIGIFSGVDRDFPDGVEAIDVQLAFGLETSLAVNLDLLGDEKIRLWIDIGGNEPKIIV